MTINFGSQVVARTTNVLNLLAMNKYKFDYFQRGFVWGQSEVLELLSNLTQCFLNDYQPEHESSEVWEYSIYFLGDIVTQAVGPYKYVIDGQQRLTSLTLLLIVLRNIQNEQDISFNYEIDRLIFCEKYGEESFNLNIEERESCMKAIYNNEEFDTSGHSNTVVNLYNRYNDLRENWPEELSKEVLPYFVDWLLMRVYFVETSASSVTAAYAIYETKNSRGLPVRPTDLLKGYLLNNINSEKQHKAAAETWDNVVSSLNEFEKELDVEFVKSWLRSKFAQGKSKVKSRDVSQDFDRIGDEFHRWFIDESDKIGLKSSEDYFQLIERDLRFFSNQYLKIKHASQKKIPNLEIIHYISKLSNTFQYMVLLSPLTPNDSESIITDKLQKTANFIETLLVRRLWNDKVIAGIEMQNHMFSLMKDIRDLDIHELDRYFDNYLKQVRQIGDNDWFGVNKRNTKAIRWLLARMTEYVEVGSGLKSRFDEYLRNGPKGYALEHICTDMHEIYRSNRNANISESGYWRNSIGGLVLVSKSADPNMELYTFEEKLKHYNSENLLTRSLSQDCYKENPKFLKFIEKTKLPFRPYIDFGYCEIEERSRLYSEIAKRIWSPTNPKVLI